MCLLGRKKFLLKQWRFAMKMVKKILFGALVAVTLTGLVGCKPQAGGNSDMFEVTGKKAVVNYENGKDFTRGFLTLKDKHLDAVCKIETTINPIAAADLANKVANGVTGVIFNYKEDEDKGTASFTIAGIRYNQSTKKVQAYVETFKDVDIDALEYELSGGHLEKNEDLFGNMIREGKEELLMI